MSINQHDEGAVECPIHSAHHGESAANDDRCDSATGELHEAKPGSLEYCPKARHCSSDAHHRAQIHRNQIVDPSGSLAPANRNEPINQSDCEQRPPPAKPGDAQASTPRYCGDGSNG